MSNTGKKILEALFDIHLNEDKPKLKSLVPQRISAEINSGNLPSFNPSTLMLNQNETCHFMDKAAVVVEQSEKIYQSRRNGSSYRVTKKFTVHRGGNTTRPLEQKWVEYKEGVLFITNERIIFVAQEKGFEKKLSKLTAITPYADALTFQFGSETITVMTPQAPLMASVLKMLH